LHYFHFCPPVLSARRPASVIRTTVTSTLRRVPATTRSVVALASPAADQLDHLLDRESVRDHDRLSAADRRRGEQFECAITVGLGEGGRIGNAGRTMAAHLSPIRRLGEPN
jgi:hypothetical protein